MAKTRKRVLWNQTKTCLLTIPEQKFFSLHGIGDPNGEAFVERIQTLYPLAYGLKAAYRKYCTDKTVEFEDYVVFPLEGVWSLTKKGQQMDHLDKN
jgi:Uncharacterized conserved protein